MVSICPDKVFPRHKGTFLTSCKISMQDYNVDMALSQKTNVPHGVWQSSLLTEGKDGSPNDTPNCRHSSFQT